MSIEPDLACNRLIDELVALAGQGDIPEFTRTRIRRDAGRIKSSDAAGAYLVLGMLDCLEWNPEGMRENHERALRLTPSNVVLHWNYCMSLRRMHFMSEAYSVAAAAQKLFPDDLKLAELCLETATHSGKIAIAIDHLSTWKKLRPGVIHEISAPLSIARQVLENHSVAEDQFSALIELVGEVLRSHRHHAFGRTFWATEEDGGLVTTEVLLKLDPESIADLNCSIAERLGAEKDEEWSSVIACSLVPFDEMEHEDGNNPRGLSAVG